MFPITTRFGNFFNLMEENTPFSELDTELRNVAKKVQQDKEDKFDVYNYVLNEDYLGPSEIITISHHNNKIYHIIIRSKDPKEYLQMAGIIRGLCPMMIQLVEEKENSEAYITYEKDFLFQIGQNLYQEGENILSIMRYD